MPEDHVDQLRRIEEVAKGTLSYAKSINRKVEEHDREEVQWRHEFDLALAKLVSTVEKTVSEKSAPSSLSDREKLMMRLLFLVVAALIVLAFGKSGIEAFSSLKGITQ